MITKICPYCGDFFTSNANSQKFCNVKCRSLSWKKTEHWKLPNSKLSNRKSRLRKYGLMFEDYEIESQNQNYVCAICGQPETELHSGTQRQLAVDHNHKTGCFRGLLCGRCNKAIGLFKDNITVMKQAIQYLERHKDPRDNT